MRCGGVSGAVRSWHKPQPPPTQRRSTHLPGELDTVRLPDPYKLYEQAVELCLVHLKAGGHTAHAAWTAASGRGRAGEEGGGPKVLVAVREGPALKGVQ